MEQASIYWEMARGICFFDRTAYPQGTEYTEEGFNDLVQSLENGVDYKAIAWDVRIPFLLQNGYDVTNENILNHDLPTISEDE